MPTVDLKFNLSDQDDALEYKEIMEARDRARDLSLFVNEFENWLRMERKHSQVMPTVDDIWDKWNALRIAWEIEDEP